MKLIRTFLLLLVIGGALAWSVVLRFLGPLGFIGREAVFIVPQPAAGFDTARELADQGLVKSAFGYRWLASKMGKGLELPPGGYTIKGRLWAWQVAALLGQEPDHLWFTSYGCVRREQVGNELALVLGWNEATRQSWNEVFKRQSPYWEGVYFPDTYLFSLSASPAEIADQFVVRFQEKVGSLKDRLQRAGLDWPTVLKIASLVQREAAGPQDMSLISGIIQNRLDRGMKLQIDATMQYTFGQRTNGSWWGPVDLSQKWADSPYNTYLYEGLPPTPICSPGLEAIRAALEPQPTDCLFYLHAPDKQIYCSATYSGHLQNIREYLS